MNQDDFSIVAHMKKFSFWGDLLIFFAFIPLAVFKLPLPWDAIVVVVGGLIAGATHESSSQGTHYSPYSVSYRKLSWGFAILCLVGACWLTHWAVLRYTEERWMGLWFGYAAARVMAIFLIFLRRLTDTRVINEALPPDPPQAPGRPAPIYPKVPTLDASGTLTLPREE